MVFINKLKRYSVEWYYASTIDNDYLIQYLKFTDKFLNKKLFNLLEFYQDEEWVNDFEDLYGDYDNEENFDYLINCDFYNFFNEIQIDVPKCFENTLSVKRSINQIELLKFNNYLMTSGLRYKAFKFLSLVLWDLRDLVLKGNVGLISNSGMWKSFYLLFSSFIFNDSYKKFNITNHLLLDIRGVQTPSSRYFYTIYDVFNGLITNMSEVLPIFNFYIYKVDKKIYKNTRGRSGKYTFIWKYISPYKRFLLVVFWLVRELKVSTGRSFKERIFSTLQNFYLSIDKTWMFRVKKFSHNYVYRNCKLTLAETYITVKK